MHTLTMPLADAILASKALLHHVSNDDLTPVICNAAVVEHEGKQYLVATDRYSFGRFMLGKADTFEGELGQMIPRSALDWVSKINQKSLRRTWSTLSLEEGGYGIRFQWSPNTDTHSNVNPPMELEVAILFDGKAERAQTYDVANGNFPAVVRLWRDDDVASEPLTTVGLSHLSLSKVTADALLFLGKGHGAVKLQFHSTNGKPAPVQYRLGDGGRWTAALQPNNLP